MALVGLSVHLLKVNYHIVNLKMVHLRASYLERYCREKKQLPSACTCFTARPIADRLDVGDVFGLYPWLRMKLYNEGVGEDI